MVSFKIDETCTSTAQTTTSTTTETNVVEEEEVLPPTTTTTTEVESVTEEPDVPPQPLDPVLTPTGDIESVDPSDLEGAGGVVDVDLAGVSEVSIEGTAGLDEINVDSIDVSGVDVADIGSVDIEGIDVDLAGLGGRRLQPAQTCKYTLTHVSMPWINMSTGYLNP